MTDKSMKPGAGDLDFSEDSETSSEPDDNSATTSTEDSGDDLFSQDTDQEPYYSRRDSTSSERSIRQIHLRSQVLSREVELRTQLSDQLGTNLKKADLREAALIYAYRNPDEIVEVLLEEGYETKTEK